MAELMPVLVPHDPVVEAVVRDDVNGGDGHESLSRERNGTCLPADASFEPHGTLARRVPRSVDGRQFPHRATERNTHIDGRHGAHRRASRVWSHDFRSRVPRAAEQAAAGRIANVCRKRRSKPGCHGTRARSRDTLDARRDEGGLPGLLPRWALLRRRSIRVAAAAIVVAAVVAAAGWWWSQALHYESTDDAFIDTRKVQVASALNGIVIDVPVTDNQLVEPGAV